MITPRINDLHQYFDQKFFPQPSTVLTPDVQTEINVTWERDR